MSVNFGAGGGQGLLPPRTIPSGNTSSPAVPGGEPVAPNAAPPAWQPWTSVISHAQSRLKTEIQASLREYNRTSTDAGRILDAARAIAAEQTAHLEAAAWAAFNKYMAQARELDTAIMGPAVQAYVAAITAAHDKIKADLIPVEHEYARILADANWTQSLTQPGGATL